MKTTIELKPFRELIGLSEDKLNETLAPARAKAVKAKVDLEMAKLETQILTRETGIQEAFTKPDVDLPRIIDEIEDISLLKLRQELYKDVLTQLFPEEK